MIRIPKEHFVQNVPIAFNFIELTHFICNEVLHESWKFHSKIFHIGWFIEEKPYLSIYTKSGDKHVRVDFKNCINFSFCIYSSKNMKTGKITIYYNLLLITID